jgi:uncharacterized protein (DUF488 family)
MQRAAPSRRPSRSWAGARIYAIGHSTRAIEEFIALLEEHGVTTVADIRTVPRSRRVPHFNKEVLAASLARVGIAYEHLPRLGGLRHGLGKGSPNTAWRNASFRGYADHMLSDEFAQGLEELRQLAMAGPVAIMCAEAVPWRCHRSLVADALHARGIEVVPVLGPGRAEPHRVTPFAQVEKGRVIYPAEAAP